MTPCCLRRRHFTQNQNVVANSQTDNSLLDDNLDTDISTFTKLNKSQDVKQLGLIV